uniref:Uncharacterized protein n=1 Tax=Aegilops tauschii subsp. strangulata TaxID=200361 RepID=A0A453PHI1_AEGTS
YRSICICKLIVVALVRRSVHARYSRWKSQNHLYISTKPTSIITCVEMETTGSKMLKPVYSAPHPLAGEMVPLTLFDRAAMDIFVSLILVYPAPTPSNGALVEGLRRAVAPYPHLAGRLAVDHSGRRSIHLNNHGVLVLDAEVPVDMTSVVADGCFTAATEGLYPALPPPEVISFINRTATLGTG